MAEDEDQLKPGSRVPKSAEGSPEEERQTGRISGRYEGAGLGRAAGYELDLRVDVDPCSPDSPVLGKVSGDLYQAYEKDWEGRSYRWRVFRHSWILQEPRVKHGLSQAQITGTVRFWQGGRADAEVKITIPWAEAVQRGAAVVVFFEAGRPAEEYHCAYRSECFRAVELEVDVCSSAAFGEPLPSYDTSLHSVRSPLLSRRVLTFEEVYRQAGVAVTVNPQRSLIDDSAKAFRTWSAGELHDAMETHFSRFSGVWPDWHLWGLLGGSFEDPGTAGVMFDAQAAYGGAGRAPDRQGFAVFRNHRWFDRLPDGAPADEAEAAALRTYLYTWIHEAGHAFNLLHSWDKDRPDALSWMNYPWRYDMRHGTDRFWSEFQMGFDEHELMHLRHGDRSAVIMGADDWGAGGHLHSRGDIGRMEGAAPLELKLRAKPLFEFLEPVSVELRLRNLIPDLPLEVDANLNPEQGGVTLHIRRPDGVTVQFAPVLCQVAEPRMHRLLPAAKDGSGEDRISEEVFLGYGADGFYFDQPGDYVLKAAYQGAGDLLLISEPLRLRIGHPLSSEKERAAQDFFSPEVGMSLYLQGSPSRFLSAGMDRLHEIIERFSDDALGPVLAGRIARGVGRDFHRVIEGRLKQAYAGDPKAALDLTDRALAFYKKAKTEPHLNLRYHALIRERLGWLQELGALAEAKKEITRLRRDLGKRGVNQSVLDRIGGYLKKLKID